MRYDRMIRRVALGAAVAATLAVTLASAGCRSTLASGTSYTMKVDRELRMYVDASLDRTHETARQMLQDDFRFTIIEDGLDGREGFIEANSAKGRYARIETYLIDADCTEVEVYVTPFGYQPLQIDIVTSLGERLGTTPRAVR